MAEHVFGGDPRHFTHYVRAFQDHLYHTFYHKISGDSMRQWVPYLNDFCFAIWDKLQDGLVHERLADGTVLKQMGRFGFHKTNSGFLSAR